MIHWGSCEIFNNCLSKFHDSLHVPPLIFKQKQMKAGDYDFLTSYKKIVKSLYKLWRQNSKAHLYLFKAEAWGLEEAISLLGGLGLSKVSIEIDRKLDIDDVVNNSRNQIAMKFSPPHNDYFRRKIYEAHKVSCLLLTWVFHTKESGINPLTTYLRSSSVLPLGPIHCWQRLLTLYPNLKISYIKRQVNSMAHVF